MERYAEAKFTYKGELYRVEFHSIRGIWLSPFSDISTNKIYTVTNLRTEKSLRWNGILPYCITRYGFYGGKERRVSPKDIIKFFALESMLSKKDEQDVGLNVRREKITGTLNFFERIRKRFMPRISRDAID